MHPYKGDNGCWLFGTDSSAVTAEEKKLRGCLNPTFLVIWVFFFLNYYYFNPCWVFHVWMISSLTEQPRDGYKKGKKKSFINNWSSLEWHEKMMTASERMGGRDYIWFSGTESPHNLAWMTSHELGCIAVRASINMCRNWKARFFCARLIWNFLLKFLLRFTSFMKSGDVVRT